MKNEIKRAHMEVAYIYGELSYCKRKQVGCIIVKDGRVISIGYNGTPPGWENKCEGDDGKTIPEVSHAEENAVGKLAKSHESGEGASCFLTAAPCLPCAKLLATAGIKEVYYGELYVGSHNTALGNPKAGIEHLNKCGVYTELLELEE